jgi:FkbM family methyltransferase
MRFRTERLPDLGSGSFRQRAGMLGYHLSKSSAGPSLCRVALAYIRSGLLVNQNHDARDWLLRFVVSSQVREWALRTGRPAECLLEGGQRLYLHNPEDLIQRHLYAFGMWEPNLTAFLRSRLKPDDVFIDVGANIGYFSLLAAGLVGNSGRVVAIEPFPSTYEHLVTNLLVLNSLTNVRVVNEAAVESEGSYPLVTIDDHNIGANRMWSDAPRANAPSALGRPLCQILAGEPLDRFRFIKVDVEGMELEAVKGLAPILTDLPQQVEILVETDTAVLRSRGQSPDELFSIFRSAGFSPFEMPNDYGAAQFVSPTARDPLAPLVALPDHAVDVLWSRHPVDKLGRLVWCD